MSLKIVESPCDSCPWAGRLRLAPGRLRDLWEATTELAGERYFVCHKTVDYGSALAADAVEGPAAVCAGWLEAVERNPATYTPAIVQVAERLGLTELVPPP